MVAALLAILSVLLATFVLAGIDSGANADEIHRGEDVSHLWETRTRAASLGGYVVCAYTGLLYYKVVLNGGVLHWYLWLAPLAAAGAAACLFGLRFDIRLNVRRNLNRYYLGTDPQTAATDTAVRARMSGRTFAWLKFGGVLVLSGAALLLASCAGSDKVLRSAQDDNAHLLGVAPHISSPDSSHTLPPRRLLGLLPARKPAPVAAGYTFGKKSTVIIQTGTGHTAATATKPGTMATGTEATAVDASKAKAPVQTGAGNTATDNTKAGSRGGASATAPNAVATATTEKENWLSAVLPWAAGVGAVGLLYLLVPLGTPGAGWLLLLFRRGRSREPESG